MPTEEGAEVKTMRRRLELFGLRKPVGVFLAALMLFGTTATDAVNADVDVPDTIELGFIDALLGGESLEPPIGEVEETSALVSSALADVENLRRAAEAAVGQGYGDALQRAQATLVSAEDEVVSVETSVANLRTYLEATSTDLRFAAEAAVDDGYRQALQRAQDAVVAALAEVAAVETSLTNLKTYINNTVVNVQQAAQAAADQGYRDAIQAAQSALVTTEAEIASLQMSAANLKTYVETAAANVQQAAQAAVDQGYRDALQRAQDALAVAQQEVVAAEASAVNLKTNVETTTAALQQAAQAAVDDAYHDAVVTAQQLVASSLASAAEVASSVAATKDGLETTAAGLAAALQGTIDVTKRNLLAEAQNRVDAALLTLVNLEAAVRTEQDNLELAAAALEQNLRLMADAGAKKALADATAAQEDAVYTWGEIHVTAINLKNAMAAAGNALAAAFQVEFEKTSFCNAEPLVLYGCDGDAATAIEIPLSGFFVPIPIHDSELSTGTGSGGDATSGGEEPSSDSSGTYSDGNQCGDTADCGEVRSVQLSKTTCRYYGTSYADGDHNFDGPNGAFGDGVYAVDTKQGAYAASHATRPGFAPGTTNTFAWADAGITTYMMDRRWPADASVEVFYPYRAMGYMEVTTEVNPATTSYSDAEARYRLSIALKHGDDPRLTTGSVNSLTVVDKTLTRGVPGSLRSHSLNAHWSEGGSAANWTRSAAVIRDEYYAGYIRARTDTMASSSIGVNAKAFADFASEGHAWTIFQDWRFKMPEGWRIKC